MTPQLVLIQRKHCSPKLIPCSTKPSCPDPDEINPGSAETIEDHLLTDPRRFPKDFRGLVFNQTFIFGEV